jgi:hypothetical protein
MGFLGLALVAPRPTLSLQASAKDSRVTVDLARARIQIHVDSSEADAVLAIVAKQAAGQTVEAADWQRLFATQPYLRLKKREAALHRDFTDAEFQQFVLSKELGQHAVELARTLKEWKKADLTAAARRVLPYLPADARIHVNVYPVIKPQTNSFVFEVRTDPAIFLYLDPALTRAQFENTVAHEMHHIGYASISDRTERSLAGLAPGVKTAVEWMGAFGEGFAMLAAAGSPLVHPHAFSKLEDRERWDRDMAGFDRDVKTVEKFFLDIIAGTLKTEEEISKVGFTFFGVQGPWYTVGYRMAVVIEKRDGRAALVECMSDPRKLLAAYNRAAAELNAKGGEQLALWSSELLEKTGAHADPSPDIQRYDLVIRPDFTTRRLRLTATVEIANPSRETEFTFLLADWYDTVAVQSRTGRAAVVRDAGSVTVRVPRASARERLVFSLSGTPGKSAGDDRAVLADSSIYLLWSDRFYPVDFDDWAIVSTRIELPRGFQVFAPGRRVAATDSGARHIETYTTSTPIRAASVIADARWVVSERTVRDRRMRTLLYPASREFTEQIFSTSADVLDFYTSRFGPYAFDTFTFATVEGIFARRAVAGGVIYESGYLDKELRTTGHDAHETALLWWFWTLAGRGPGSYQWTEGFGDYAEMQYDKARGLPVPPDFELYRRGYLRTAGTADELSITAPRGPLRENFVHGRLPWLMHVLRFAVGDSAYDRGMRLLFDRWRFRSFTLEEFVATLAEGAAQPLDWWRSEWLERRGVPELTWHADITPDSAGYRVAVSLRQAGSLYHLPLEIGIESAQGLRIERVQLDEVTRDFRFWSASEPTRVVIDPRRWLLARITAR